MNTLLRKYLLGIVAVAFTLLTLTPHHHHDDDEVCVTMRVCHQDGRINDEHTSRCHNVRLDRHHLYAPAVYKPKAIVTAWDNGGCGGAFLSPDFWNESEREYDVHPSGNLSYYCGNETLPHHDGRHWKRRGPPMSVLIHNS